MSQYQRIVVPCDEAPHEVTLAVARGLGAHLGIPVVLFSVVSEGLEARDTAELERMAASAGPDVGAMVRVDDGRPLAEQVAEVASEDGTLMCMPTHARAIVLEAAFGSIGRDVLRLGSSDIVAVGPNCARSFAGDRLLIAIDSVTISATDRRAALELSDKFHLETEFVTVMESEGGSTTTPILDPSAAVLVGQTVPHRTLPGQPADVLTTISAKPSIAMIAVSPRHRHSIERLLVGSTTRKLLRQAECPVLIRQGSDAVA